jgi:hypothetical protein
LGRGRSAAVVIVVSQVRKLDERQMHVQRVLAMVEDIINLKGCAEGIARALDEGELAEVGRRKRGTQGGTEP